MDEQYGTYMDPNQEIKPSYKEGSTGLVFKITTAIFGLAVIVLAIFVFVYYGRANETQTAIAQKVKKAEEQKTNEAKQACDVEKTKMLENPWDEYSALPQVGSFKFNFPRGWARYEKFEIKDANRLLLYFNPVSVYYDIKVGYVHSALELNISKDFYADSLKKYADNYKKSKEKTSESEISVSGVEGTGKLFIYKNRDLPTQVAVAVIPFRSETMLLKTDDYQKNKDYFDKVLKSLVLTP